MLEKKLARSGRACYNSDSEAALTRGKNSRRAQKGVYDVGWGGRGTGMNGPLRAAAVTAAADVAARGSEQDVARGQL